MEKNTEKVAAEALLERGFTFKVPATGLLRLFGKQVTFTIRELNLGAILMISKEHMSVAIDEEAIEANPFGESWKAVSAGVVPMSRIIAIAILRTKLKIWLFTGMLSIYLRWHVSPAKTLSLSIEVLRMANVSDFMNTIRLIQGINVTRANRSPVEQGG